MDITEEVFKPAETYAAGNAHRIPREEKPRTFASRHASPRHNPREDQARKFEEFLMEIGVRI